MMLMPTGAEGSGGEAAKAPLPPTVNAPSPPRTVRRSTPLENSVIVLPFLLWMVTSSGCRMGGKVAGEIADPRAVDVQLRRPFDLALRQGDARRLERCGDAGQRMGRGHGDRLL